MSESNRMQRWRQRQREAGKESLTIWLTTTEKLRLEDMALTRHCSPSALVQRALAQLQGESPGVTDIVTDTVTDTSQLRAILQQELARVQVVTDTVTDTITGTLHQILPSLLRLIMQEQRGEAPSLPSVTETVTDTDTDTVILPMTYPVTVTGTDTVILPMTATVTETVSDTTASPTAKRKAPSRQGSVTDTVTVTGQALEPFDTAKYILGKLCPRGHAWGNTGQSLLRRTNRHCCACDREKFQERGKVQRQARRQQRQQEGQG